MTPAGNGKASRPMYIDERFPGVPAPRAKGALGGWRLSMGRVGGVTSPGVRSGVGWRSEEEPVDERGGG